MRIRVTFSEMPDRFALGLNEQESFALKFDEGMLSHCVPYEGSYDICKAAEICDVHGERHAVKRVGHAGEEFEHVPPAPVRPRDRLSVTRLCHGATSNFDLCQYNTPDAG